MSNQENVAPMTGMTVSPSIAKVAVALVAAQAKMGTASKDAKNPFFKSKYADINAVREAALPALADQKVGVFQPTVVVNGRQYVRTLLLHESGEFMAADTEVLCSKPNDPQALGSAITYARRYGLQSFMNIASEDDDGESAVPSRGMEKISSKPAPASAPVLTTPVAAPVAEATEVSKPVSSFNRKSVKEATNGAASATPKWS